MVYLVKSKSDFDKQLEIAGDKLVVVDFFATWCGPCKMIGPQLDDLAKKFTDKAIIIKVDVDECEDVAMEFDISTMPTFIFFRNKQQIDIFSGALYAKLVERVEKNL